MEILRKTLKTYILAIILFILLTFILAAVINYTAFKEEWAFAGLVFILTVVALVVGFLEEKIIGKKGVLTGMAAAALLLLLILFAVGGVFLGAFAVKSLNIYYLIPLLAGAVGGILGANSN